MELRTEKKHHSILLVGVFLLITSFSLLAYNSYNHLKNINKEKANIEKFFQNKTNTYDEKNPNIIDSEDNNTKNDNDVIDKDYNYTAILEIPALNLKKGLVNINSKYNDVKYNVEIIESSTYPNIDNGNFILAAHSGNDYYAYFKDLSKLELGNSLYIYYNGIKYQYILDKIYDIEKNGTANIVRDSNETTITLITCKENTDDKQVVYIGYLLDKNPYN